MRIQNMYRGRKARKVVRGIAKTVYEKLYDEEVSSAGSSRSSAPPIGHVYKLGSNFEIGTRIPT